MRLNRTPCTRSPGSKRAKLDAIAAAEAQLAASKARLIAVMAGIKARPEGIGCTANAERLLTLAQLAPRAAD